MKTDFPQTNATTIALPKHLAIDWGPQIVVKGTSERVISEGGREGWTHRPGENRVRVQDRSGKLGKGKNRGGQEPRQGWGEGSGRKTNPALQMGEGRA